VEKGSIAVDGISLTVTETDDSGFGVSLIPHTAKMTTLGYKSAGDAVNLETDILARYVEKMLGMDKKGNGFSDRHKPGVAENENSEPELTEEFLLKHGF
jgi:riboflavin synthase